MVPVQEEPKFENMVPVSGPEPKFEDMVPVDAPFFENTRPPTVQDEIRAAIPEIVTQIRNAIIPPPQLAEFGPQQIQAAQGFQPPQDFRYAQPAPFAVGGVPMTSQLQPGSVETMPFREQEEAVAQLAAFQAPVRKVAGYKPEILQNIGQIILDTSKSLEQINPTGSPMEMASQTISGLSALVGTAFKGATVLDLGLIFGPMAVKEAAEAVKGTNWFRKLTIPERGLVLSKFPTMDLPDEQLVKIFQESPEGVQKAMAVHNPRMRQILQTGKSEAPVETFFEAPKAPVAVAPVAVPKAAEVVPVPEAPKVPATAQAEGAVEAVEMGKKQNILGTDVMLVDSKTIGGINYEIFVGTGEDNRGAIRTSNVKTGKVIDEQGYSDYKEARSVYNQATKDVTQVEKQPWEMTRGEYLSQSEDVSQMKKLRQKEEGLSLSTPSDKISATKAVNAAIRNEKSRHEQFIIEALRAGKPVPPSVLADYPDLKAEVAPKVEAPIAEVPVRPVTPVQAVAEAPMLNIKEVEPSEAGYHNSYRAYDYDTPYFKGYLTTDFSDIYGSLIRQDRLKGEQLKQFNIVKSEFNKLNPVKPGYAEKVMTLDSFNDTLKRMIQSPARLLLSAPPKAEAPVPAPSPFEQAPNMPASYVEAKKRPDGVVQLFYKGTTNEVFPGEKFKTVSEARQYFKAEKVKYQEAQAPVVKVEAPTGEVAPPAPPGPPKPPVEPPVSEAPPPAPMSDADLIAKVRTTLAKAKPEVALQKIMYSEELAKRFNAATQAYTLAGGGRAGFNAAAGQLKGELEKRVFEEIEGMLSQQEVERLYQMLGESPGLKLMGDQLSAKDGLDRMLSGRLPQKAQIAKLEKVFGRELVEELEKKRSSLAKMYDMGLQLINIPRSLMASLDLSAPFRQGIFFVSRPEFWGEAWPAMIRSMRSETAFNDLMLRIENHPLYVMLKEAGLDITGMSTVADREEDFQAPLIERAFKVAGVDVNVPGRLIRASGRAYVGFLNKLRMDVAVSMIKSAQDAGFPPTQDLVEKIVKYVNAGTGRGGLGPLQGAAGVLNAAFFSPRLIASRVNLMTKLLQPSFYEKNNAFIRRQYLRDSLAFVGLGMTVLGLAKLAGADVGDDPRSSDFGKIKVGNTRLDIWGGFQQYARMMGQLVMGEYVSSITGKVMTLGEGYKPLTRKDILQRQIESKLSPVASFMNAMMTQQDWEGKPVSVKKEILARVKPLAAGDFVAVAMENPRLLPISALGFLGFGSQTYGTEKPPDMLKMTRSMSFEDLAKTLEITKDKKDRRILFQAAIKKFPGAIRKAPQDEKESVKEIRRKMVEEFRSK